MPHKRSKDNIDLEDMYGARMMVKSRIQSIPEVILSEGGQQVNIIFSSQDEIRFHNAEDFMDFARNVVQVAQTLTAQGVK